MRGRDMKQKSERKREKMKEKNWGKEIFGKIVIFIVLALAMGLFFAGKVQARELDDAATLYVAGETIVYAPDVVRTVVKDSKGGTAVYDFESNTLTLTNFYGTSEGPVIQADWMGDDFKIIMKGINTLETSYTMCISIRNGSLNITGGGLNLNQGIVGDDGAIKVQNCSLNINSTSYGICSDTAELEIDDAVVNIRVTKQGELNQFAGALDVKKLTVRNSNITTSVPSAGITTWAGEYAPRAIFVSEEGGIDLSSDLTVTNEKGQKLYQQIYYGGTAVGNKYIYTTEKTWDINADDNIYKISDTVKITSSTKTKQIEDEKKIKEVIALISRIGTVSGSSGDEIKAARDAYDSLSEEQKKKITNYQVLKNAEAVYGKIQKTEQAQKSKVSIKKLKSTKKKTMTLTWKRDKSCNGYQIAYSTKKNFKSKKLKNISKNKTVKYTFKKLKSKKTYYVKIRPYTKIDGKKVYGAWSKVKKVKVK